VIDDVRELAALFDANPGFAPPEHPGAVFRSPAWWRPWWERFGAAGALASPVATSGRRLLGVLPAWRARGPLGLPTLRLLGDGIVGSDHLGVVGRAEDAPAATAAIADWIVATSTRVRFDGVTAGDRLVGALSEAATRRGARLRVEPLLGSPFLDLRAAPDFDRWLDALPRGAGAQLRRRRRWLERRPGFAITVARSEEEVAAAIDALFALHASRWAGAGGSEGIRGRTVRDFHRDAARALARRDEARVWLLAVEGAPRAALYGFERGGRFSFYQSGLDPAWRPRSVGTVLLCAAIEDAVRRGLSEFDFLRGDEDYKARFASGRRQLLRLRLDSGLAARSVDAVERAARRLRRLAAEGLPAFAVEAVRRRRRAAGDPT
jgi:CelD/BcsL family acetyltransferase involved in cellulose biosynthesis